MGHTKQKAWGNPVNPYILAILSTGENTKGSYTEAVKNSILAD